MQDIFAFNEPETLDTPSPRHSLSPADLLSGMNPEQAMAVETTEGPLLVLAGAGTGKTRVLTHRVAYIIQSGLARPDEILAVTFTNKAAREMAERMEHILGYAPHGMWLGTFHRLGVRFLRQHAELAGLKPGFVILDTDDQQRLLGQIVKDVGLDVQEFAPRLVAHVVSRFKDEAKSPEDLNGEDDAGIAGQAGKIYREYQARLSQLNAVDFGDLLLLPLKVLLKHDNIRTMYQTMLRYILVDEYQDTNSVQYQWLKALAAQHKNLCVVGDDDQSIYGWRGAQVGNILRFEHDFEGAKVVRLEQNYRSTGHILAAANAVIANNRTRHDKALWTEAGEGDKLEIHPILDDREEARMVAERCAREVRAGSKSYNDMAVLVRTAAQTRSLEEQFIRMGLPYIVVGGQKFYDRKEIKDLLAYLRVVVNDTDDLAFQRIVNVPKRGVGEVTLLAVEQEARATGKSWVMATRELLGRGEIAGKAGRELAELVKGFDTWRILLQMEAPERLAEKVLEESGYAAMLRDDKDDDGKTRLENLKELLRAMQDYGDLNDFLEHVALVTEGDTESTENVRLMTIHAAKGLEFPLVFLPGFEEGVFPHQRALNEEGQKGLEEERRLAYVAMTRARQQLVLSYTSARRMYGQFMPSSPSRFLAEIPEIHKDVKAATGFGGGVTAWGGAGFRAAPSGTPSTGYGGGYRAGTGSTNDRYGNRSGRDFVKPREPMVAISNPSGGLRFGDGRKVDLAALQGGKVAVGAADAPYSVGQRVRHEKFGNGRVVAMEGKDAELRVVVDFVQAGTKRLLASLARLEVL